MTVSALALGTVAIGVDYGIAEPGGFGRPDENDAVRLVREALDRGVTLIDTAPAYGESERIVGRAAGRDPRAIIATKVAPSHAAPSHAAPSHPAPSHLAPSHLGLQIRTSLESSLRALNRDVLDIVQIHNATRAMLDEGEVTDTLLDAQRNGLVRVIGASVYGEDAAMAVIESGVFGVLQIALNVLDQRMMQHVLPAATAAGIGIIVRSAFLKGALTPKAQWLPDPLGPLRDAAARARDLLADGRWDRLPEAAMRFCLSVPGVGSVLTGARIVAELDEALAAEVAPPFDWSTLSRTEALALTDDRLLNPSYWPVA